MRVIRILSVMVLSVVWLGFGGCGPWSPNSRFVDGVETTLYSYGGYPPWELDVWDINYDGSETYGAGFGFVCEVSIGSTTLAGIIIECMIYDHSDPVGISYDIWDQTAPNGEKYGYVTGLLNGTWDFDGGIATARTNGDGQCVFFVGLGNPLSGIVLQSDPGYEWPGDNELVSTLVEIKLILRRHSGEIVNDAHMFFFKAQYQGFEEPFGGIIGNSWSALGEWSGAFLSGEESITFDDGITLRVTPITIDFEEIWEPKRAPYEYDPPFETSQFVSLSNDPNDPNAPEDPYDPPYLGDGWTFLEGSWSQLVFMPYGWDWVEATELGALWLSNSGDPNDSTLLMTYSNPYAFWCVMNVEMAHEMNAFSHSLLLISKDSDGQQVSWLPIKMNVVFVDMNIVTIVSDFIVPMQYPEDEGLYHDLWGMPYVAIYVPDGGHLEIKRDNFYGDFNSDSFVDELDYSMLTSMWQLDPNDATFDLIYDADHNGRIGPNDLRAFTGNWLGVRP